MARFHIDVHMRWGDQDSYGHINNVHQARYFEEARVRSFFVEDTREKAGLAGFFRQDTPDGLKTVLAGQSIEFLQVLEYGKEPLDIEMWIGRIGASSITLCCEIRNPNQGGILTTRCTTTLVTVNGTTFKPARISDKARQMAENWMDDPLQLGR